MMTSDRDPIYLDHHATTPLDPRVLDVMQRALADNFGNPASKSHPWGWRAREAVDTAREQVAALIGATPKEIVFTSGATEADNLAIQGAFSARSGAGHLVVSAIEHPAVLDAARALQRSGARVSVVPPDAQGIVQPDAVTEALGEDTVLVSVMFANNEIGTLQPLAAIAERVHAKGALFHVDAAQGLNTELVDVKAAGIDLLSMSAHKMYGPKGVGALYVNRRIKARLVAMQHGGGHERGLRSGTLNAPGIIAFGAAAAIARDERADDRRRVRRRRDRLLSILSAAIPDLVVHGDLERRLAGNLNVGLPRVEAEALILRTNHQVAISSGSACASASIAPSHVLRALGVPHDLAHCSVRIGIGRTTTDDEIERAGAVLAAAAKTLRADADATLGLRERSGEAGRRDAP